MHMVLIQGEQYFRQWYARVCTRCFGSYLPFTFMTPVIDMVNHSHKDNCTFHVFNADMHKKQEK